jgi:hypothetical protein
VEISQRIANLLRDIASARGRSEEEVLDEALVLYLRHFESESEPDIGRPVRHEGEPLDPFLELISRMRARFDLDEEEAMRIAVEEQHAFRRERAEREGAER